MLTPKGAAILDLLVVTSKQPIENRKQVRRSNFTAESKIDSRFKSSQELMLYCLCLADCK